MQVVEETGASCHHFFVYNFRISLFIWLFIYSEPFFFVKKKVPMHVIEETGTTCHACFCFIFSGKAYLFVCLIN